MTKVLVTGATGFIGGALVRRLVKSGVKVTVLVRKSSRVEELENEKIKLMYGDLKDRDSVFLATKGQGMVYNCAAILPNDKASKKEYFKVNADGVGYLADACIKNDSRLIHVSTTGIYGDNPQRNANTNSMPNPGDDYAKSKLQGEAEIKRKLSNGLKATIIRPTIAYGPGDMRPVFLSLFRAVNKPYFFRIGAGESFLHTVYIENLVDAMLLASKNKSAIGEDFIIGDRPCPRVRQITANMEKLLGKGRSPSVPKVFVQGLGLIGDMVVPFVGAFPLTSKRVKFMTTDRKFSISKAQRLLGYSPKVRLKEGLANTYDWYKMENLL